MSTLATTEAASVIERLTAYVVENCEAVDADARYREMLDECYSFKSVGGPFAYMSPASVLESQDPTAYRCGKNDYDDSCGYTEIGSNHYNHDELEEARDKFVDALESELTDAENDLEADIADNPGSDNALIVYHIDRLKAEIAAAKRHTF